MSSLETILEKLKIKEGAIVLLISYGGFGTFLPNVIKSASSLNGISTFETLTWFGIAYFLLPAFLFLVYWNFKGFQDLIRERLSVSQESASFQNQISQWQYFFLGAKIAPVVFLFVDKYFFYDWSLITITIYLIIGVLEYFILSKKIDRLFSFSDDSMDPLSKIKIDLLKYSALISFLNLGLGIGLLYFSEPWFLYRSYMILILWVFSLGYAILIGGIYLYSVRGLTTEFASPRFIISPLLFLFALIYLLPHVNRKIFPSRILECWSCSPIVLDTWLLLGLMGFLFLLFLIVESVFSIRGPSRVIWFGVFLYVCIPYVTNSLVENENSNYFQKRVNAANEITNKKLIPQFSTNKGEITDTDRLLLRFADRNNHFLRVHGSWRALKPDYDSLTMGLDSFATNSLFENGVESHTVINNFNRFTFIRDFYYNKYPRQFENDQDLKEISTDQINDFYSGLYTHLKDNVFPNTIIPLSQDQSLKDISGFYTHPLNYYSYVVDHYGKQIKITDRIIHNLKYLDYINKIEKPENRDSPTSILPTGASIRRKEELNEDIQKDFVQLVEFMGTPDSFDRISPMDDPPVKSFEYFKTIKQEQFNDRIKSAQIIYQSYLYDYQRIGVFLFLILLVCFGFIWYHIHSDFIQAKSHVLDSKGKGRYDFIGIAFFVVTALLLPLVREIKAENIDPQKKFWMLNLSNWYSPGIVFPEISDPKSVDEEKKDATTQFENSTLYYNDILVELKSYNDSILNAKLDLAIKGLDELKNKGVKVDNSALNELALLLKR